jgi:hypothetical protein
MNPPADLPPAPAESRSGFWVTLLAILGCFIIFLVVLYLAYLPERRAAPQVNLSQIPADQRWMYTPAGRMAHLQEMRAHEQSAQTTYAWIDRSKGIVQLPIARAEELTLRDLNAQRKP